MKILKFTYLILSIFFLFSMIAPRIGQAASAGATWKGSESAQKEPLIQIVETGTAWSELWMRALGKPAPEVDFERSVVACVFLGHQADWLYAISIGEPIRLEKVWIVQYSLAELVLELSGPFKARGQYAMKVLEKKKDAPMVLEERGPYGIRK